MEWCESSWGENIAYIYIHKYIYLYLYMRTWCAFHIDQLNSSLFLPCAVQRSRRLKSQSDSLTKGDFRIMPPSAWQNIHAMFQAGQGNGPNFSKHIGMASTRGWTAFRSIPSLSSGETKRLAPRNSSVLVGNDGKWNRISIFIGSLGSNVA